MTAPFLARLALDGDEGRWPDEAARQFLVHAQHLQDPASGLFFHGWDEGDDSHLSAAFWQRGNGWAMVAGAERLDLLPSDHPARREIGRVLVQQAASLVPLQDRSGLWHTVVTRPDFYLETSGVAAIGYALLRGLDQGWLDAAAFNAAAQRVRHGVAAKVAPDGIVLDVSMGTGVGPTLDDYDGIAHQAISVAAMRSPFAW